MHQGRSVFSQVLDYFPRHEFNACVRRYRGNYRVRQFTCFDQFLCMAFAQLTSRDSLRDVETCLRAFGPKLYHAGFRGPICRSTLADANEHRDWRIYADFAQVLIGEARTLYAQEKFGLALKRTVYAFDSTTVDLCLKLFPWARFRRRKGAVKLHTQIDLRGNIPCFLRVTAGSVHDVKLLDQLPREAGAFYLFDRGYIDFARLHAFTRDAAYFVTRAKKNLDFGRRASRPVNKGTGLRSDQTIILRGPKTALAYPDTLRRISYVDPARARRLVFLTNNFQLSALTITRLYRCRWQVELFFKWIKQHLRIKAFLGQSPNAVKTQVWIATSVYVLVAILKKRLAIDRPLGEILQILSVTLFEKSPLFSIFQPLTDKNDDDQNHNYMSLFDF
jgi:Domain of unknown function (DUF4372)/Transposase DDE domain